MKKTIISVLLVLISWYGMSQKAKENTIKISYFRTPKYKLSNDRKVKKELILMYMEDNKNTKDRVNETNKARSENAQKNLENYEKKKTSTKIAERVLLGSKKPSGQATHLKTPFLQKEWESSYILSNGCSTNGLANSNTAKAKIKISVLNFESDYSKSDNKEKAKYSYTVTVKAGLKIDAFDEKGNNVASSTFINPGTMSSTFDSEYKRNQDLSVNENTMKRKAEANAMKKDLYHLQQFVKENFDYYVAEKKIKIYTVNSKKGDYSKINDCFPIFSNAFQYLNTETSYNRGIERINEIIPIYEAEIKEYVPKDKKARINEDIAKALYLNLCQAYIWTKEFEKAKNCIIQYRAINTKRTPKELEKLSLFLEDQKRRAQK